MQTENTSPQPFRFTDPRQARIHERLNLVSPAAAPFYRDACRIMATDPPFESTTHLVAHLIRELESSLRAALEPYKDRPQGRKAVKPKEDTGEKHKDDIKALLKGLDISEKDPIAVAWLKLAGTIQSRAHRDNLAPPRPVNEKYRQFWNQMTDILFVVLDKLESRYLVSLHYLDALLAIEKPTRDDAKRLQLFAPNNPATYGYFFHWNNNPAWLKPLRAQKIFDHPQEPISEVVTDGTRITYPPWPQSRYLVRMAASSNIDVQQTVLEIALKIETENIAIHMDLVDVAKALPAAKAVKLSEKTAVWIRNQNQLFHQLPEKLGELISHLASGGEVDAALQLARSVLTVLPNPRAAEDDDSIFNIHRDPVSRLNGWDYQRVLRLGLPALVAAGGARTLEMFCDLLETAINYHQAHVMPEETNDLSSIWRRDLEYQGHEDVKDHLVSAVRKAAEQIATDDPGQVPALVNILEARRWLIFKRMALYLLRLLPTHAGSLIIDHLMDRTNFDEGELWHEYILLMRDHFIELTDDQRNEILGWIDEGPSLDVVKERRERWDGVRLTDEEAEKMEKFRKLRLLAPLRDVLPEDWRGRYEQWVKETEEPQHAEYTSDPPQMGFGFGSPKSTEELRSMSIREIIIFLADWQRPGSDPFGPTPEGLGRELTALVASEPERFAKEASRFRLLAPTYVRSFLSGLLDAANQPRAFGWSPVFTLCRWVLKQPREIVEPENQSPDEDRDWFGARSIVAELLSAGFKAGVAEIPFTLRTSAWKLLRPFTNDPNPTPENEERQGGPEMDVATSAVNTIRGKAMYTVMNYALWVQRHIKEEPDGEVRASRGFDEMPEVRKTLDYHLNPKLDPSLTIRSIYGQWLPWLIMIDQNWVKQNLSKIFPKSEASRDLCNAAWQTYITFNGAYSKIFEVLRGEYERAIERIRLGTNSKSHYTHTPDQRLAQHLMLFYGRGELDLNEPDGLLTRFYLNAPDELCAHALWSVGYAFRESKEPIPTEVLQRFQALWQKRLNIAGGAPESHVEEMSAFGYLFYSEKFDDTWAITELKNALELSKKAELDYFVIQRLAALADIYPGIAIDCFSLLVEGDKEGWGMNSWGGEARTIIAAARHSEDENARQAAVTLIHRLGARNYLGFQDLL
jgi:hypothetical protein